MSSAEILLGRVMRVRQQAIDEQQHVLLHHQLQELKPRHRIAPVAGHIGDEHGVDLTFSN